MQPSDSAGRALQADIQYIKIGQKRFEIGEKIHTKSITVFDKSFLMAKIGDAWKDANVEGKVLGVSQARYFSIEWTCFQPPIIK